jgi:predicted dehydrogenase
MTPAPLRIGLVGYGFGGRRFHAPLLSAAAGSGCELAAVVTRSPARRAELAADRPGVPAVASLAELAAAGVDAVVVSTPLPTHAALVGEAIELGLPVVCDKPFTADGASARATVELAERAGVGLSVYQNRRWDADFLTVAKVLAGGGGELGEVARFESRLEQPAHPAGLPTSGGGALLDLGSHAVDQAMILFGAVRAVYAEVHLAPELDGVDDRFFVSLAHLGGTRSHLWGSWSWQGEPMARFRVVGQAATYAAPSDDGQTARTLAGRAPGAGGDWGTVEQANWGAVHRAGVREPVPAERGDWGAFYAGLAAAVRGGAPMPVDPWDAVAAIEVLDAASASAASGAVVALS